MIGWDLMVDVAVLGPVRLDAMPAAPPFDTNRRAVGADLFTIGYPGETEPFPQPTISRGILSRYRRWPQQEVTYLQTDASLDGGQSGGVLASSTGAVVGMTVFGGFFGHFGMALSAADLLPRVAALLAGEDPAQLGDRGWREAPRVTSIRFSLDSFWSVQAFVIEARADQEVTFAVRSRADIAAQIVDVAAARWRRPTRRVPEPSRSPPRSAARRHSSSWSSNSPRTRRRSRWKATRRSRR